MSAITSIEWTDRSWNPLRARLTEKGRAHFGVTKNPRVGHFCVHVSPGCEHCYAEARQPYYGHGAKDSYRQTYLDRGLIETYLDEKELLAPLRWKKPCRVFVCSMTDLFGAWVPDSDIDRIFAAMALCPHLTFQVLTKRSQRMREYMLYSGRQLKVALEAGRGDPHDERFNLVLDGLWPLPNVWLGVSVEDQKRADERIPDLLATPAAVRFLSVEPMRGAVDLTRVWSQGVIHDNVLEHIEDSRLDLVICGGESGPRAEPMHPDWPRSLRDQCVAAGVAFFHKQNGEYIEVATEDFGDGQGTRIFPMDDSIILPERRYKTVEAHGITFARIGKKAAGRMLDGKIWDQMPGRGK